MPSKGTPITEVGYSSDLFFLAPALEKIQRSAATGELTAMERGRWERIGFWTIKARYERRAVQTLFRHRCTYFNEHTRLPVR